MTAPFDHAVFAAAISDAITDIFANWDEAVARYNATYEEPQIDRYCRTILRDAFAEIDAAKTDIGKLAIITRAADDIELAQHVTGRDCSAAMDLLSEHAIWVAGLSSSHVLKEPGGYRWHVVRSLEPDAVHAAVARGIQASRERRSKVSERPEKPTSTKAAPVAPSVLEELERALSQRDPSMLRRFLHNRKPRELAVLKAYAVSYLAAQKVPA